MLKADGRPGKRGVAKYSMAGEFVDGAVAAVFKDRPELAEQRIGRLPRFLVFFKVDKILPLVGAGRDPEKD